MSPDMREAVWNGDVDTQRRLVAAGADPDGVDASSGWSGLMLAAGTFKLTAVAVLLDLGADSQFSTPDGWTEFHTPSTPNSTVSSRSAR